MEVRLNNLGTVIFRKPGEAAEETENRNMGHEVRAVNPLLTPLLRCFHRDAGVKLTRSIANVEKSAYTEL